MLLRKTNIKLLFLLVSFVLAGFLSSRSVTAQSCEEMPSNTREELTAKISCLEGKASELRTQANTLSSQIAQFNSQIYLTELKIEETKLRIEQLGGRINQLEVSLGTLSNAFSSRASETYKMFRLGGEPATLLLTSENPADAVSRFQYLKKIQESDRELLARLQEAQDNYVEERTDQEELNEELAKQSRALSAQKAERASLLAATQNDERRYQSLLSQARAQLAAFRRFTQSRGGATLLSGQTVCDGWGCYYSQRDSEWGNMLLGETDYTMKDSGCFITSVAMLAQHAGRNVRPPDIAQLSTAITSGGLLSWSFNVNGVNVSIGRVSSSELDQRLASGPVMAELYGGSHFIVIVRKEGSSYIMHDPFLENGNNRTLSDGGYSVSDISSLRVVNFN